MVTMTISLFSLVNMYVVIIVKVILSYYQHIRDWDFRISSYISKDSGCWRLWRYMDRLVV